MENTIEENEKWSKERTEKGAYWIGSSDICSIVGLNKHQSRLELWALKTKKIPPPDPKNPFFIWGKMVEPAIRELFKLKHPEYILEPNAKTFIHERFDWAVASPDNFISLAPEAVDIEENHEGEGICEMKTSASFEGWDDGIPNYAHVQTMWQLEVCKRKWARVAGVVAGRAADLKTPFFQFDQAIANSLIEQAEKFRECILKDIPPDAGAGDSKLITELIAKHETTAEIPLEGIDNWIEQFDEAENMRRGLNEELSYWTDKFEEAKNNIRKAMGSASIGVLRDGRRATVKVQHKQPYTVTPKPIYVFRLK